MHIGVKFCGGCNPRFDRGKAYEEIRNGVGDNAVLEIAQVGVEYDRLLIIGGCTNCCASYSQYTAKDGIIRMWDKDHIESIINTIINGGNDI